MSQPHTIISGEDVARTINTIIPAIQGQPRATVLFACLALACEMVKPDIKPDVLEKAMEDLSTYLADYFNPLNTPVVVLTDKPETIN